MSKRFYDAEFSPGILTMLKEREILSRANFAQGCILIYNLATEAELLVRRFTEERKANPVLETTRPEAWIAAQIVPSIREIRPNIDTDDAVMSKAVQENLCRFTPTKGLLDHDEQTLCTTIEPYRPYMERLFLDLFDRSKSLRAILGLRRTVYGVRNFDLQGKPFSRLEDIILRGLIEQRKPRLIAITLDEAGLKPRRYKSYVHMLEINSHSFYSLKNNIKTKYRAHRAIPAGPNLN